MEAKATLAQLCALPRTLASMEAFGGRLANNLSFRLTLAKVDTPRTFGGRNMGNYTFYAQPLARRLFHRIY